MANRSPSRPRSFVRPLIAIAAIVVVFAALGVAEACPSCKTAIASKDEAHVAIVAGYFWSIIFMMSMPFALVAGFSTYAYVLVRRARAEADAARATDAPIEAREPETVEA